MVKRKSKVKEKKLSDLQLLLGLGDIFFKHWAPWSYEQALSAAHRIVVNNRWRRRQHPPLLTASTNSLGERVQSQVVLF